MSIGTEIVSLLTSNSLGTYGTDLFLNALPETPATCGAVFETAGAGPTAGFGFPGIQHESPGVQIRFRGERYDDEGPRVKAQTAYRLFMTVQGSTLSGTKYLTLHPTQAPFILDRDGDERVVWAFNALAVKELSAAI